MPRLVTHTAFAVLFAVPAACHGGGGSSTPEPAEHSLAGIAAQHVAVLPTYGVRIMPGLGWSIGSALTVQHQLDADIAAALEERAVRGWILPEQLMQRYRRNSTYATDPSTFAEEPLRAPNLEY